MAAEGDKEVAYPHLQPGLQRPGQENSQESDGRRVCGMKSKWFYGLLVLLIVLAIGLGVGLGVGLGTRNSEYDLIIKAMGMRRLIANFTQQRIRSIFIRRLINDNNNIKRRADCYQRPIRDRRCH